MTTKTDVLLVKFETDGEGRVRASLGGVAQDLGRVDKAGGLATASVAKIGGALAGIVGIGALTAMAKGILEATANYQRLNAALVTVTGSAAAADKAFAGLRQFAATTPFQLNEVVDAFIKLKARGLDPSEAALRSYGNTAGATGKTLDQVIEAVGDAATGEFERLKEFGIVARTQGDKIQFTFQGVKTTVEKEAGAIEGYLRSLGNVQFAGGMERQAATLGGAWSNAKDAAEDLAASIGTALSPMLIGLAADATHAAGEAALLARWLTRVANIKPPAKGEQSGGWMKGVAGYFAAGPAAMAFGPTALAFAAITDSQRDAETDVGKHELAVAKLTARYAELQEQIAKTREIVNDPALANMPAISSPDAAKLREYEQALVAVGSELDALTQKDVVTESIDTAFERNTKAAQAFEKELSATTTASVAKLRELAATYGLSKSQTLEYEKAQALANETTAEGDAALAEQYDALIAKVKAEEAATAATHGRATGDKAAAAAARERAKAEREAGAVIARMADDFKATEDEADRLGDSLDAMVNPLAALTDQYQDYLKAVQDLADLEGNTAAANEKKASSLALLKRWYDSNTKAIEAQQKPVAALIADMEFELKLMKMSNTERQAAIALRGLEADATKEQKEAIAALSRDMEMQAAVQATAEFWGDAIRDQIGGIVDALKKGGGSIADSLAETLSGSLDRMFEDSLSKFSSELGNLMAGTGGATGGSVMGAAGNLALNAVGSIGASHVGGTSSMGESVLGGAAAGAVYGARIGSIIPVIGTAVGAVVGAIIGAIVGFVAHQNPILEVSASASGINHGKVEGRATSAFGDIFVGKDDLTLQGNMQSQELAEKIASFDNAIASFLTGAEIQAAKEALADFDFNQRGHGLGPGEVLAARFNEVIASVAPEWKHFLDGISDLETRVSTFQALRVMGGQITALDALIDSIGSDPFEQLRFAVHNLQQAVTDTQGAFDAAVVTNNATDMTQASEALTQAIMRRYQAELEMVLKLADALAQVERQARTFNFDIAQRIAGVGGSPSAVTAVAANNLLQTVHNFGNAQDATEALEHLNEFISTVDQWLQSARAEVNAWHAEQTALLAARLAALDEETNAINAAAGARAQADAQYQAEVQAAHNAAIEAERQRLQGLLTIAQEWVGVLGTAQALIDDLTRSAANPMGAEARLNLYDVEIERLRDQLSTASEGERAGIASQLTQLLGDRLALGQEVFDRPSDEYMALYNETLRMTGAVRDMAVDPAARAAALQEELNALQQGTTDAVSSFASQSANYTDEENARLEAIDVERRAIADAQRALDEEAARRLGAIDDEARAYYTWAQGEGQRLLEQQHQEITDALDLITGGIPVPEYVIGLQERAADALENIRDSIALYLANATQPVGGGAAPPIRTPGEPGDPGNPRDPGPPRDIPLPNVTIGELHVHSNDTDPHVIGQRVIEAIANNVATVAGQLKPALRVA